MNGMFSGLDRAARCGEPSRCGGLFCGKNACCCTGVGTFQELTRRLKFHQSARFMAKLRRGQHFTAQGLGAHHEAIQIIHFDVWYALVPCLVDGGSLDDTQTSAGITALWRAEGII